MVLNTGVQRQQLQSSWARTGGALWREKVLNRLALKSWSSCLTGVCQDSQGVKHCNAINIVPRDLACIFWVKWSKDGYLSTSLVGSVLSSLSYWFCSYFNVFLVHLWEISWVLFPSTFFSVCLTFCLFSCLPGYLNFCLVKPLSLFIVILYTIHKCVVNSFGGLMII
jgi:hypothetical protein